MPRGGFSGGGGGFSGGGFSGGRGSGGGGGRASGGRSGGGGSHRGGYTGGGFSGGPRGPIGGGHGPMGGGRGPMGGGPHHHHHHGGMFWFPMWGGRRGYRGGGGGCGSGCAVTFLVIFLIFIVMWLSAGGLFFRSGDSSDNSSVTRSTVERKALPRGLVNETGYYTDELDWITNRTVLETGMKNFYAKTGVQPYLYITGTVNGKANPAPSDMDAYANELYDKLFKDEAHLLVLFWERDDNYKTQYVAGTQAKTVIDAEAADILLDYIDRYYYGSLTEDEFFSKAFNDAGNRVMSVTASPWIPVLVALIALCILCLLFFWWSRRKKQKNLEAEQTAAILGAPLEGFRPGATGLEDKYKN